MKVLTFLMFCLPISVLGTTGLEEGIILQEELRFLEEASQKTFQSAALEPSLNTTNNSDELDLESTYFNDQDQDEVSTRAGAPRRRR